MTFCFLSVSKNNKKNTLVKWEFWEQILSFRNKQNNNNDNNNNNGNGRVASPVSVSFKLKLTKYIEVAKKNIFFYRNKLQGRMNHRYVIRFRFFGQ